MAVVVKNRVCRQCSAVFPGGLRSWYCPACRSERARESNRQRKARGTSRPLGSTDFCVVCGAEFRPYDSSVTCSKACSQALKKQTARNYEAEHRAEINARKRQRLRDKLSAMTPEELAAHRKRKENAAK